MKKILKWTWELPQTLLGLALLSFYKKTLLKVIYYKEQKVYIYDRFPGGISLGRYILIDYNRQHLDCNTGCSTRMRLQDSIKHEAGHGIQSRYLGPLYLLTVGLCSVCWNLLNRTAIFSKIDYFSIWPENWADKLGGVHRC